MCSFQGAECGSLVSFKEEGSLGATQVILRIGPQHYLSQALKQSYLEGSLSSGLPPLTSSPNAK
jgi:hypothetical protein